jgi:hypothetical protein
MIKELTDLSPAEILLIENPQVKVDKLARVTFFDLILNEIPRFFRPVFPFS